MATEAKCVYCGDQIVKVSYGTPEGKVHPRCEAERVVASVHGVISQSLADAIELEEQI